MIEEITVLTRVIAYQTGQTHFSPCMQKIRVAKISCAPASMRQRFCRTIHAHVMRQALTGVFHPFPLLNSFNQVEVAQLFKLASAPPRVAVWD